MIKKIYIENFILIDKKEISFTNGINVLSGETGHGKSILLRAIVLLFKGTISKKFIRDKNKKTKIIGELEINKKPFKIERVFDKTKSIIKINNKEVNLYELESFTEPLLYSFTQFQKFELLNPVNQLAFIDSLNSSSKCLDSYKEEYIKYEKLSSEKSKIQEELNKIHPFIDYLTEELSNLEDLNLSEDDLQLEKNLEQFNNYDELISNLNEINTILNDENSGLTSQILSLKKLVNNFSSTNMNQSFEILQDSLNSFENSIIKETNIVESIKEDYSENLKRIEQLKPYIKKHNNSILSLIERYKELQSKINRYTYLNDELSNIDISITKLLKNLIKKGKELSKERRQFCTRLIKSIRTSLNNLNLEDCELKINLKEKPPGSTGIDLIEILARTNIGSDFYPLEEVSSGGELSRIIFSLISQNNKINLLCFDEIDAGVGGKTIISFCKELKKVSKNTQIICISHNPAIAIIAENNINVTKENKNNSTISSFNNLNDLETIKEISRMLGYGTSKKEIEITKTYIKELIHQIQR